MKHERLSFRHAALLVALAVVSWPVGCGLSSPGAPPDNSGKKCSNDAQCKSDDPCSKGTCSDEGVCETAALPDGDRPDDKPGDCMKPVCKDGAEKIVVDDTDTKDDGNPCSSDECHNGKASHPLLDDGAKCEEAGHDGTCKKGLCEVKCETGEDCASDDPCTIGTCDLTNICDFEKLNGVPTPRVTQKSGDCHTRVCLQGVDTNEIDDSDLPMTATDCDEELCDRGEPSNPPRDPDSVCSTDGGTFCGDGNALGKCVGCNDKSQCAPSTITCVEAACQGHVCGFVNTPPDTQVAPQATGDCHIHVCDGNGAAYDKVDDGDVPVDGNDCTNDICTNGAPSHTNKNQTTPCGNALVCDANGNCMGCTLDSQCQPPSYQTCGGGGVANVCGCTPTTCAAQGKTCGVISNGCGGTVNCDDFIKNGNEGDTDCGALPSCGNKCANGRTCTSTGQCASGFCVDGFCCNSACNSICQACSAFKKGTGADGICGAVIAGQDPDGDCPVDSVSSCDRNGACDGSGQCQNYAAGTVCNPASCASTSTLNKPDTCNGSGTCNDAGTTNCAPYTCSGSACRTSCANSTECASTAYCSNGSCVPKLGNGQSCVVGGAAICSSGFCADGRCCNAACDTDCKTCNNAAGTCTNVGVGGTDDNPVCASPNACNGNGVCLQENGTSCSSTGVCASGNCPGDDNKCCDAACTAVCYECSTGTCKPSSAGSHDNGRCQTSGNSCDGNGACN